jgi:hypothetical protein
MKPEASFATSDTLRAGFNVTSMQLPDFIDTVKAICAGHGADMLIALDSINLRVDWDINLEEDDEGSTTLVKDFFLYVNNYMTLYSSGGEVVDRCAGEKSAFIKSKRTIFGMFGGPTVATARESVRSLARDGAKDCLNKFYPFTEHYTETLYNGGPLKEINELVIAGHPEEAVGPLTDLVESSKPGLAYRASSNLAVVNIILENSRKKEQIMLEFAK